MRWSLGSPSHVKRLLAQLEQARAKAPQQLLAVQVRPISLTRWPSADGQLRRVFEDLSDG